MIGCLGGDACYKYLVQVSSSGCNEKQQSWQFLKELVTLSPLRAQKQEKKYRGLECKSRE